MSLRDQKAENPTPGKTEMRVNPTQYAAIDALNLKDLKRWMVYHGVMVADQSLEDLNVLYGIAEWLRGEIAKIEAQGRKGWQESHAFELFGLQVESLGEPPDGARWAATYNTIGLSEEDHYWYTAERIALYPASARASTVSEAIARATAKALIMLDACQVSTPHSTYLPEEALPTGTI
jgi:hypothetical protein